MEDLSSSPPPTTIWDVPFNLSSSRLSLSLSLSPRYLSLSFSRWHASSKISEHYFPPRCLPHRLTRYGSNHEKWFERSSKVPQIKTIFKKFACIARFVLYQGIQMTSYNQIQIRKSNASAIRIGLLHLKCVSLRLAISAPSKNEFGP